MSDKYPTLDALQERRPEIIAIHNFLDYLTSQGIELAKYDNNDHLKKLHITCASWRTKPNVTKLLVNSPKHCWIQVFLNLKSWRWNLS